MSLPKLLWMFKPQTQDISVVLPLFDRHGDLSRLIVICGGCQDRFSIADVTGISFDAYGAMNTVRSIACPHCNWRAWIEGGVVTLVTELWCPSCGMVIPEKPHFGWIQHNLCGWEGKLSDVLVRKPNELDLEDGEPPTAEPMP